MSKVRTDPILIILPFLNLVANARLTVFERYFLLGLRNVQKLNSSIDNLRCSAGTAGVPQYLEYGLKESDELWSFLFHGAQREA